MIAALDFIQYRNTTLFCIIEIIQQKENIKEGYFRKKEVSFLNLRFHTKQG